MTTPPKSRPRSGRSVPARWKPSGIVSLCTDFGLDDPYVGLMKGVLLSSSRELLPIDLTHGIAPQDVRSAAFFLAHSWSWFPAGTVHVAVVDPGVGSERRILVARDREHAFLAPDNGLLGPVLSDSARVFALDVERFSLPERSRTFHGRDVFAPAAARIASGLAPAETGAPIGDWLRLEFPSLSRARGGALRGEVLLADHFGNLITNVQAADLSSHPGAWSAEAGGERIPVHDAYSEVAPGELLALVDSYGFFELAVRGGSAARRLDLGPGAAVVFRRRRS